MKYFINRLIVENMKKQQMMNDRVRLLREAARLTPTEFAVLLKLSSSLIQKVETGEKPVSTKLADRLITEWRVPENWLINGVGEMAFEIPSMGIKPESASPWRDEAYALLKSELESWKELAMKLAGNSSLGKLNTLALAGGRKESSARVN